MAQEQRFGVVEGINPPISISGTQYSLAVRFFASAESDPWPGPLVVSGTMQAITSLGSGRFRIACARGPQSSSVTKAVGLGNVFEDTWESNCGGNICVPPEPLRIYCFNSENARRGDYRAQRLEKGDIILVGPPGAKQALYVEQANAMNIRPATVDYRVGNPLPRIRRIALNWITRPNPDGGDPFGLAVEPPTEEERILNPGLEVDVANSVNATGLFREAGFFLEQSASPGNFTALTRKVFNRPAPPDSDGAADVEYFPAGATLAQGEYWWNSQNGEVRVASLNANIGTNMVIAAWWRGWRVYTSDIAVQNIVEGTRSGEVDQLDGVEFGTSVDGPHQTFLYDDGTGDFGEGWMVWEFVDADGGTVGAAMRWSGNQINAMRVKTTAAGSWAAQSIDGYEFVPTGGNVVIAAELVEGVVSFYVTDSAVTDELIGSVSLSVADEAVHNGFLSLRAATSQRFRWAGFDEKEIATINTPIVWRQTFVSYPSISYVQNYPLDIATAPVRIISEVDRLVYTEAANVAEARQRGKYLDIGSATYQFYSENSPDLLRFEYAGVPLGGSAPGRAPRANSQLIVNLSTFADAATQEATTNPDQNRANWFDELIVRAADVANTPLLGAGDTFDGHRGAVLDPTTSFTLQYAVRDASETEWQAMDSEDFYARPVEGVFLIAKDFLDDLDDKPCFRLTGTFIQHHANFDARNINELARAADKLGDLFFRTQSLLGGGNSISAGGRVAISMTPVVTGWATWIEPANPLIAVAYPTGFAWGWQKGVWGANQTAGDFGAILGAGAPLNSYVGLGDLGITYLSSTGGGFSSAAEQLTTAFQVIDGEGNIVQTITESSRHTLNGPLYVWPATEIPAAANLPPVFGFGSPLRSAPFLPSFDAVWKLEAIPVAIPPEIRRLPAGATIVKAWLTVRVEDIESYSWGYSRTETGNHLDPGARLRVDQLTCNGELVQIVTFTGTTSTGTFSRPGFIEGLEAAAAPITFGLWGRRKNTGRARRSYDIVNNSVNGAPRPDPIFYNIPNDDWVSFSSGGLDTDELESGKWGQVDVTRALRAIHRNKDKLVSEFYFIPSAAIGYRIDEDAAGLANFGREQLPNVDLSYEVTLSDEGVLYSLSGSASGQYTTFTELNIGDLFVQVRFPDSLLTTYKCPIINRDGMIPPPE
jgi:hypothetical protein